MAYRIEYSLKEKIMNLPTKITVSRIIATVLLIIALFVLSLIDFTAPTLGNTRINLVFLIVFVFFVIASYTDHLDGKLARKNNQVTDLGKFLDPIADKLLVNTMLIFLVAPSIFASYAQGQVALIPVWCVIIMVARDTVVDAMRFIAAQKNVVIAANIFGKLKTVLQMVAISAVLLNDFPFHYMYRDNYNPYLSVTAFLVYAATLVSFLSGVIYVYQNRKVLKEVKE